MAERLNLLFTSAGRRVELLRAFRSAFRRLDLQGTIIAIDADPLAPALRVADRSYVVPRLCSARFLPVLLDLCRRERVALVFPLNDLDVPVLAASRAEIEGTGATAMVVDQDAAAIVTDKWRTHGWLARIGMPTPRTWRPGEMEPGCVPYPVFVKPRRGSASVQCFKAANARELQFFSSYVDDPIVQEWLPGPEITTDVICDASGAVLGVVSRQRLEVRWGEVAKGVTVYDATIADQCARIARELRAIGPITVQGMWNGSRFAFTEINARFGGGAPLGIAAGADSPSWLLARAAGLSAPVPPIGHYRTNVHLTRFDDSFILTEGDDGLLARHHL